MKNTKLLVIDFDGTIINHHSHNEAREDKMQFFSNQTGLILNGESYDDTIKNKFYRADLISKWSNVFFSRKDRFFDKDKQTKLFRDLLNDEVKVVIASFSQYPEIIEVALKHIGLTCEEAEKIDIICGAPKDRFAGKNEHIRLAMDLSDIKDTKNVIFVDDNAENINRASGELRVHSILAKGLNYLNTTKDIIQASESVESEGGDLTGDDFIDWLADVPSCEEGVDDNMGSVIEYFNDHFMDNISSTDG